MGGNVPGQDGPWPDCVGPTDSSDHVDLGPRSGTFVHPPSLEEAMLALDDLKKILRLPRLTGGGYKDPGSLIQSFIHVLKR